MKSSALRGLGGRCSVKLALAGALFWGLAALVPAEGVCQGALSVPSFSATGVLLSTYTVDGQEYGMVVCTAILIESDAILTAAHCTHDFFDGLYPARHYFSLASDVSQFGRTSTDLPPQTFEVMAFMRHPEFTSAAQPLSPGLAQLNDLAVGFLDHPVCFVAPAVVAATLDRALFATGAPVTTVGYGDAGPESGGTGLKHHADGEIGEVGRWEIQIRRRGETPLNCHGDSGGPTYAHVGGDRLPSQVLIGITSRSFGSSDCLGAVVDSRLDVYRDWIHSTLRAGWSDGIRHPSVCTAGRDNSGLAHEMAGSRPPPRAKVGDPAADRPRPR